MHQGTHRIAATPRLEPALIRQPDTLRDRSIGKGSRHRVLQHFRPTIDLGDLAGAGSRRAPLPDTETCSWEAPIAVAPGAASRCDHGDEPDDRPTEQDHYRTVP